MMYNWWVVVELWNACIVV